jgi:diacylglycerol O-acyltransferase / wax synthase
MQRLTAMDASFWYLEDATTPMQVGSVAIFEIPDVGFDHERLVRLIGQRIAFVPRYRQRVREVPLGLGRPVWVDDAYFDLTYHVRRSALPRPGSMDQLEELVARLMSRPLDRGRPLWEVYLVEGLVDGRFALVSKTHQAMVDGLGAVDLLQVLLDDAPQFEPVTPARWHPVPEPSDIALMTTTVTETLTRPSVALEAIQSLTQDFAHVATGVVSRVGGMLATALTAAKGTGHNPLNVEIGSQRRFATATFTLDEVKAIRQLLGGTVNDVLLAAAAGGLRSWLMSRGIAVDAHHTVRVLVPISTPGSDGQHAVSAFLVELPTGEPDPIVRFQQIQYQMQQIKDVDELLGADAILAAAGFGPATLHALGARIGSKLSHRLFNLVVTNVPGPQRTLYVGGARMVATYPSLPLTEQQALSIALTSYDGCVYVGLTADRDAVPDLDVIRGCLRESLDELHDAAKGSRRLRSVSRKKDVS